MSATEPLPATALAEPVRASQVWLVIATVTLLTGFSLWMARIDVTLTAMHEDVTAIKSAVTKHAESPGHREAVLRLRWLEKKVR